MLEDLHPRTWMLLACKCINDDENNDSSGTGNAEFGDRFINCGWKLDDDDDYNDLS